MAAEIIPLVELLGEIPDFRQASGKRYPLAAILALACAAMLCGYRSYGAIAEWGRNYGGSWWRRWVFGTGRPPVRVRCIGFFVTWIAPSSRASWAGGRKRSCERIRQRRANRRHRH